MTLYELFEIRRDINKLKSLHLELARHENFNPFKPNIISDMPRGNAGERVEEWYTEERERILNQICFYEKKIQEDRRILDRYIEKAPYPECDIIRFRVINDMSWEAIGAELGYSRRSVARKFHDYIKTCP